jgi:glc operon protein GlcG
MNPGDQSMRRLAICALVGMIWSTPVAVHAQPANSTSYATSITLAQATHLIDGARSYAQSKSFTISIVVLDAAGYLVASARMDGAPFVTPEIARGKAYAAIATGGVPGDELAGRFTQNPMVWSNTASLGYGAPLLPAEGGLPIFINGALAGAVGASGAPSDEDVNAIGAGIASIGATTKQK